MSFCSMGFKESSFGGGGWLRRRCDPLCFAVAGTIRVAVEKSKGMDKSRSFAIMAASEEIVGVGDLDSSAAGDSVTSSLDPRKTSPVARSGWSTSTDRRPSSALDHHRHRSSPSPMGR
ncbi:unnamed protein product [Linum trigynum]